MVAAFALNTAKGRQRIDDMMAADSRHQAYFLADQIERALGSVERVLNDLAGHIQLNGIEVCTTAQERVYLSLIARTLAVDAIVSVYGPDGGVVATNYDGPTASIKVDDRDYFRTVVARDSNQVVIGNPIHERLWGDPVVPVARAVRDREGRLIAVITVALKLKSLTEIYRRFLRDGLNVIAIQSLESGEFVLRVPPVDGAGYDFSERPPFMGEGEGSFIDVSPVDQQERFVSFKRVAGFPLVAVAGVHTRAWKDYWLETAIWRAGWLVVGLALSLAVYWAMARRVAADSLNARRLEAADRAKSNFLAAASHDLRQPVQAMRLYLEVLSSHEPTANHKAFGLLGQTIAIAEELLNSLLQVSAIESGTITPVIVPVHVGNLMNQVCDSLGAKADEKGVRIKAMPSQVVVRSDQVLISQILSNLVGNAIKYTNRGRVLIGCRRRNGAVVIEVYDNGMGIPAEKLEDIFGEFVQLGNSERDGSKGLGLGLSIVRKAAMMLGYRVDVRSVEGKGSRFSVVIPGAG